MCKDYYVGNRSLFHEMSALTIMEQRISALTRVFIPYKERTSHVLLREAGDYDINLH